MCDYNDPNCEACQTAIEWGFGDEMKAAQEYVEKKKAHESSQEELRDAIINVLGSVDLIAEPRHDLFTVNADAIRDLRKAFEETFSP